LSQGAWLGFRAAAAGDRFLQARRRGGDRLGFSNANLGTWEQWELAAGGPEAPWARLRVSLRSRRLPQVGAARPQTPSPKHRAAAQAKGPLLTQQSLTYISKELRGRLSEPRAVSAPNLPRVTPPSRRQLPRASPGS